MPASGFPKPRFKKQYSPQTSPQVIQAAEKDRIIWELRLRGMTAGQIAQELGHTTQTIQNSLMRAAKHIRLENADEIVKAEVERLDILLQNAIEVLEKRHLAFSHGKLLYAPDENDPDTLIPLEDSTPVLKAIDTILKIMERRAKILGLDAPARTEAAVKIQTTDSADLELMDMINSTKAQIAAGLSTLATAQTAQTADTRPEDGTNDDPAE